MTSPPAIYRSGRMGRVPYAHTFTDDDYLARWYDRCVIAPTDCILWQGPVDHRGYPRVFYRTKRSTLTRLMYRLKVGPIPAGMQVCHKCDVRNCINYEHLWLGTHQDNMDDMNRKGRNHGLLWLLERNRQAEGRTRG